MPKLCLLQMTQGRGPCISVSEIDADPDLGRLGLFPAATLFTCYENLGF